MTNYTTGNIDIKGLDINEHIVLSHEDINPHGYNEKKDAKKHHYHNYEHPNHGHHTETLL